MAIEDVLANLRGMGTLDSQGSFTFDVGRARLLLEKYRLPSAVYFMLHAVGAAVASHSSRVDIELRSDLFQVSFDGDSFAPEDVEGCFASLWSDDPALARMRELAIARGGAAEWGASEFILDGRSIRVPKKGLSARLRRALGGLATAEGHNLLEQHLVSTPSCTITLNRRPLQAIELPAQVRSAAGWQSPELLEQVRSLNPVQQLVRLREPLVLDCQGMVCWLLPEDRGIRSGTKSYWPGYLDLVLHGRLYRTRLPERWSDCWGMFWLNGLRRDLSHIHLRAEDLAIFHRLFEESFGRR